MEPEHYDTKTFSQALARARFFQVTAEMVTSGHNALIVALENALKDWAMACDTNDALQKDIDRIAKDSVAIRSLLDIPAEETVLQGVTGLHEKYQTLCDRVTIASQERDDFRNKLQQKTVEFDDLRRALASSKRAREALQERVEKAEREASAADVLDKAKERWESEKSDIKGNYEGQIQGLHQQLNEARGLNTQLQQRLYMANNAVEALESREKQLADQVEELGGKVKGGWRLTRFGVEQDTAGSEEKAP